MAPKTTSKSTQVKEQVEGPVPASQIDETVNLKDLDAQIKTLQAQRKVAKEAAKANTGSLKKEIASTQRLVKQSVKTINRFAREFGLQHET